MERKNLSYLALLIAVIFLVSGCSTVPKKFREEVSGMRTRIDSLESKVDTVESKQVEAERMASQQNQAIEDLRTQKERNVVTNVTVKPRSQKVSGRTKDIQVCLRNAGFYKGEIDGVKGKGTKKAIKEFQKANGLKADGVVGPKTWDLLSKYGAASAESAGTAEEGTVK